MTDPSEFISAYESALESQQWENVAPLVHENCTVTFNNGTYIGKSAVEGAFRTTFQLIEDETYKISNIHWVEANEVYAVMIFNFEWTGIIHGEPASGGGRGTSVLVWNENRWQLLSEHLGPLAPEG